MKHPDNITRTREGRNWRFTTPDKLSEEEAKEAQIALGYHPYGYNFNNYEQTDERTTWTCWDNCD